MITGIIIFLLTMLLISSFYDSTGIVFAIFVCCGVCSAPCLSVINADSVWFNNVKKVTHYDTIKEFKKDVKLYNAREKIKELTKNDD